MCYVVFAFSLGFLYAERIRVGRVYWLVPSNMFTAFCLFTFAPQLLVFDNQTLAPARVNLLPAHHLVINTYSE